MVQLLESDIHTKEVLQWKGLHVFHFMMSSCSQKLRIYLNLKGLTWHSHPIDIAHNENLSPWYLGINPRGLVPTLVHNGAVHIDSNDIILHLEREFPSPPLVPTTSSEQVAQMLKHEDELHLDLRTLTFRFMFDPTTPLKSAADLERYASGPGIVRGERDAELQRELAYWSEYLEHGVSDEAAREAAGRFRSALDDVDRTLAKGSYILDDELSIVDVAWVVYVQRLVYAGYPLGTLHPHVNAWWVKLKERPEIGREMKLPDGLAGMIADRQRRLTASGQTLAAVCFHDVSPAQIAV